MNPWIEDICAALENLGGIAHRSDLMEEIRRIRPQPHPPTFVRTVQQCIQAHSSDSNGFRGPDLLYSVNGIGSGVWGLRSMLSPTPVASDLNEVEVPGRVLQQTYRVLRDTELARKIKRLHQNRCQLCGHTVQLPNGSHYAEAHHIRPLGGPHSGPDVAENIVVVCPNHHVELDYGVIELCREHLAVVHGHVIGSQYIEYHNTVVRGGNATYPGA
jgi:hypothetical protein